MSSGSVGPSPVSFPLFGVSCSTRRSTRPTWRAEQALRPAIVTRKVCGGNRSCDGAHSQHILASVIRTTSQRQLNPHAVLASLLHARTPHAVTEFN